ncbi:hypothetical protein, partial [Enhygromyxa salina]|uniref:hypothetical protein n=1 Tax=Enhygromyxa salina TaxID=215803 RepID=UPI001C626736
MRAATLASLGLEVGIGLWERFAFFLLFSPQACPTRLVLGFASVRAATLASLGLEVGIGLWERFAFFLLF